MVGWSRDEGKRGGVEVAMTLTMTIELDTDSVLRVTTLVLLIRRWKKKYGISRNIVVKIEGTGEFS